MSSSLSGTYIYILLHNDCAIIVLNHGVLLNFKYLSVQNNSVHNIIIVASSEASNYASMLILVLHFCS